MNTNIEPEPVINPVEDIIANRTKAQEAKDTNADICFLSLADEDGLASVRTLVLRNIKNRGFSIFINQSSPKWKILSCGGSWQILLWYASQQKQYRISGSMEPISEQEVRESWKLRPDGSKWLDQVYETLGAQSSTLSSRQDLLDHIDSLKQQHCIEDMQAPSQVGGITLNAESIERLDLLNPDRIHDRRLFTWKNNQWVQKFLIP